jgi:hypothetical protein
MVQYPPLFWFAEASASVGIDSLAKTTQYPPLFWLADASVSLGTETLGAVKEMMVKESIGDKC